MNPKSKPLHFDPSIRRSESVSEEASTHRSSTLRGDARQTLNCKLLTESPQTNILIHLKLKMINALLIRVVKPTDNTKTKTGRARGGVHQSERDGYARALCVEMRGPNLSSAGAIGSVLQSAGGIPGAAATV
ncbi:hypothetical protein Tco_1345266 [Tanacetum coccineum]